MSRPRPFEAALRLVPDEWRESIRRDLEEEADLDSRSGWAREAWLICQVLAISFRFFLGGHARPRRQRRRGAPLGAGVATDFWRALRTLRRAPWSTSVTVATLALGIGPATAIYAVFNYVVFRPLPGVVEPDRLVSLYYQVDPATPRQAGASYAHLEAMRDGSAAVTALAAWSRREVSFATDVEAPSRAIEVMTVSRGWFDMLGVRPTGGRFFSPEEYEAPGHDVVVVSEDFARRAFGGARAIGRDVRLNGRPFRIVGIASEYVGLDPLRPDAMWAPYHTQLSPDGEVQPTPGVFSMVGRLRPGVTIEQAQAQVRRASQTVGPITIGGDSFEPTLFLGLTDGIGLTRARLLRIYTILMAGAVMLLVLACLNAANLMLARNLKRQRDLVVRGAIGASRSRLLRELIAESSLLAAMAAALGLALSIILVGLFRGTQLLSYLPALDDLAIDGRVAAFCVGLAAATLALFAVVPALMASRVDLQKGLRASARSTPGGQRLRSVLVATQFALSLTLLAVAGLMIATVWQLRGLELGVETEGTYAFELAPSQLGRDWDESATVFRETRRRLEASPGISSAAVAWSAPFGSHHGMSVLHRDDAAGEPVVEISHPVSPEYFEVLGIPLIAGRTFTQAEDRPPTSGLRNVVVNEAFAREWFGTPNASGRVFEVQEGDGVATVQVIGVVGNARYRELRDGFVPMVYVPAAYQLRRGEVIIRTSLGSADAAALVRRIVHEVDPLLPAGNLRSIRDDAAVAFAEERLLARLGVVIAALAALLAAAGLYAVIAAFVNDRMHEFGIRRALGASGTGIVVTVIRRFALIISVGTVLGAGLVVASTRLLAARLYGVSPLDPTTLGAAAAALTLAAVLAAWLPTRRALRVDPAAALRAD